MIILQILGILAIFYGIAAIVINWLKIARRRERDTYGNVKSGGAVEYLTLPFGKISVLTGIFLVIFLSMIYKVDGQEVAVKITPQGVKEKELLPGRWYILMPWVKTEGFDITQWVYTFADPDAVREEEAKKSDFKDVAAPAIWVNTKDQISMKISFSLTWAIDPNYADWIYSNISTNAGPGEDDAKGRYVWIEQNIIKRLATSAINDISTKYTTSEVYTNKRPEIAKEVFQRLQDELKTKHLVLLSVDIQKAEYNPDYAKKLLDTKLAQQEAIRMIEVTKVKEEELKQASINKDIAIQQAEGEAKALQIKGNSIAQNPKIIELEWITCWAHPSVFGSY
jgi:regulator of protease activity HflC (stomatin/prohibitin superfamily)